MKTTRTNKILSLLLSMLMLLSVVPMTALAADEPAVRTFYVEADQTEVYAGDIVTVTVRVDGTDIFGAEWRLEYNEDYFELIEQDNRYEYWIVTNNTPLAPDQIIATYKFKALAQTKEAIGNFTLESGAVAQTRLEAVSNTYVAPVVEGCDVKIKLKTDLAATVTVDSEDVGEETEKVVAYTDDGHKVNVTSNVDDAAVVVKVNGEVVNDIANFEFKDVQDYVIEYTITKDGYVTVDEEFTLKIVENTVTVTATLDGNTVENQGESKATYDGSAHTFSVASNPEANIVITVNDIAQDNVTSYEMKNVGVYEIGWTVTRTGYATVEGTYTFEIEAADITVTTKLDDVVVENGGNKEIVYDGEMHTFAVTSEPEATITLTVGEDTFTGTDSCEYTIDKVGEYVVNYTVAKEGYTTVEGTITIKYTDPEYVVEVAVNGNDYVSGKKIVLVYTNNDDVSFTYGSEAEGLTMLDVTSKGYTYDGTEEFTQSDATKVYAVVVNTMTAGVFADYKNNVNIKYDKLGEEYVIAAAAEALKYDVNNSTNIEIGDPIAVYGAYAGDEDYYPEKMAVVLRADINGDKQINGTDNTAVTNAYEATRQTTN